MFPVVEQREKVVQHLDAAAAFAWAEEILDRCAVESQFAKFRKIPGFGEFTMDELRDQALTIVKIVERMEPVPARLVFRYVYGREDGINAMNLLNALVRHVYATAPEAAGKHPARMGQFVHSVSGGFRRYRLFNKKQHKNRIADDIGLSRKTFYEAGWLDITIVARGALDAWIKLGEDWLKDEMQERGFVA